MPLEHLLPSHKCRKKVKEKRKTYKYKDIKQRIHIVWGELMNLQKPIKDGVQSIKK